MIPQLAGYFDSDLWRRLVLQACEQDVSICNGITALAALMAASEVIYSTDYVPERYHDAQSIINLRFSNTVKQSKL
jgi:hypothetical protein